MIPKIFKGAIGLAALGAGALTIGAVALGNRRIDRWETLTPNDADDGDFVTLSDGARMHYLARGGQPSAVGGQQPALSHALSRVEGEVEGSAVVLIHGLMGSADEWAKNMDALAQERRVWAIDLIGFGFSSRLTEPTYSLKYFARSVCEFLDAQGAARASIVGHSLGGAITLQFAHDYPARVDKLILVDAAAYLQIPAALNLAARVPCVPRALVGLAMTSPRARTLAWRNAFGSPKHLDARETHALVRAARVQGTADAMVAMMASRRASDLPHGLKKIAAPTLILWGDKDRAVPLRHCKRLARDLPHAELVIVEGAGHVPHIEFPETVNRLMNEFLG